MPQNNSNDPKKTDTKKSIELEDRIDEMNDESFPASDPPNWSALARRLKEVKQEQEDKQKADREKLTGTGRAAASRG